MSNSTVTRCAGSGRIRCCGGLADGVPVSARTVATSSSAATAGTAAAARRTSPAPPRGQTAAPMSAPISPPMTTSVSRTSASFHVVGASWAKSTETTMVKPNWAAAGPSRGPAANVMTMAIGSTTA